MISRAAITVYFVACTLLLAACSTGRDELVAGQQYEDYIQAGNGTEQVPLPDGAWQLIAWDYNSNLLELAGVLIQTRGRKIAAITDFYVPYYTSGRPGDKRVPIYAYCGRTDTLYVGKTYTGTLKSYGGTYRTNTRQDCWGIDHWPVAFYGRVPRHLLLLRDHIESQGTEFPSTMIAARFRKADGHGHFMSANYYFNPEPEGFAPPRELDWRSSEWHRDRAFRDPDKKAYIEKLISWAESWDTQVNKGLKSLLKRDGP